MPLPPTEPHRHTGRPPRANVDSPLAMAIRVIAYRRCNRERPRERAMRVLGMAGALLVHLLFLFGFILGPAFEVNPRPESKDQFVQVRLIELPEPPPTARGTPPKELGSRHQGHAAQSAQVSRAVTNPLNAQASTEPSSAAVMVAPVAAQASASPPHPPAKPVSLPPPAPPLPLSPVPLAGEPPVVTLPKPSVQLPVPPKFQPEPVRPPQLEGNRPLLPPPSLALPAVPAQAPPPIAVTKIALSVVVPKSSVAVSVAPVHAEIPAAPVVPEELPAIPVPVQPSPSVNLRTALNVPTPRDLPRVQAPAVKVVPSETPAQLEAMPLAPLAPAQVRPPVPAVKIAVTAKVSAAAVQPSISQPALSASPAAEVVPVESPAPAVNAAQAAASKASEASPAISPSATSATPLDTGETNTTRDVSTAPDATPQGSDNATPGQPSGTATAENAKGNTSHPSSTSASGQGKSATGKEQGIAQSGGNQPGAEQGEKHGGTPGGYIQLKPHGDTEVMNHGTPNLGYQPTRFEQNWTPEGESSIDTALRHAVEKTTVAHTFHLPRGVRIKCSLTPLLPMALFGCGAADPPPEPVTAAVYDRLHLPPAHPLAPPTAPASSAAPPVAVKLDNSVQCAVARVAGGPPPPDCEGAIAPVRKSVRPASSSSSWVPASDQFH